MLKKVGMVTAAAVALSLVAAPAFAATTSVTPQDDASSSTPFVGDWPTFGDAFNTFVWGGGALGAGAAALVAGAYTGIATTPALVLHSVEGHHHAG